MRLSRKAIAACALLSFSPLSFAEIYLGGAGTMSALTYDDVKAGFGGQAYGGFKPESFPMMFEVGYVTSGKNKVDGAYIDNNNNLYTNIGISFTGETASLGYYGKFNRNGSGAYGKLGYYTGKAKLSGDINGLSSSYKQNSSGAMFGFGVDLMMTRNFGFRFDLTGLLGVHDYKNFDIDHTGTMTLFNAGVVFAFGGSEPQPRYGSRYQPAPVYTPAVAAAPVYSPAVEAAPATPVAPVVAAPAPISSPVVEMAPAPVVAAAPAMRSSTAGSAQLVPGAVLRSGPTMKSAGIRTLPDGGSVKLLKRESNAEGPWWSVQLEDGTTGWIIEWGLARISKN